MVAPASRILADPSSYQGVSRLRMKLSRFDRAATANKSPCGILEDYTPLWANYIIACEGSARRLLGPRIVPGGQIVKNWISLFLFRYSRMACLDRQDAYPLNKAPSSSVTHCARQTQRVERSNKEL